MGRCSPAVEREGGGALSLRHSSGSGPGKGVSQDTAPGANGTAAWRNCTYGDGRRQSRQGKRHRLTTVKLALCHDFSKPFEPEPQIAVQADNQLFKRAVLLA